MTTPLIEDLIILSVQKRTTQAEEDRISAWRREAPENERQYCEVQALWSLTGEAAPEYDSDLPEAVSLIERAEAREAGGEAVTPIERAPSIRERTVVEEAGGNPKWIRRAAIGALAAGFVAVGFGIGALSGDHSRADGYLSDLEITTGAGEMTTVGLGDGSTIRVGSGSHLRMAHGDGDRTVWMRGRAFFGVQADSARPFTVHTDYGDARALGTRFEVRSEEGEFRVLVVEGAVSVSAGGSDVRTSEGEMTSRTGDRALATERVTDVFEELGWLRNTLVFQATPFERVVREVERRYGVSVTMADTALEKLSITATFTDRPLQEVILVLCEIVSTTCSMEGDRVLIGSKLGRTDARAERR